MISTHLILMQKLMYHVEVISYIEVSGILDIFWQDMILDLVPLDIMFVTMLTVHVI